MVLETKALSRVTPIVTSIVMCLLKTGIFERECRFIPNVKCPINYILTHHVINWAMGC